MWKNRFTAWIWPDWSDSRDFLHTRSASGWSRVQCKPGGKTTAHVMLLVLWDAARALKPALLWLDAWAWYVVINYLTLHEITKSPYWDLGFFSSGSSVSLSITCGRLCLKSKLVVFLVMLYSSKSCGLDYWLDYTRSYHISYHIISYHIISCIVSIWSLPGFKVSESKYIQLQTLSSIILMLNLKTIPNLRYLLEKKSMCRVFGNMRECCNALALPSHTPKKKKKMERKVR